ncbi:MAG: DUF2975 domain-containing protein [Oscillospiraceae bacterium]|nr:DUF2975 domain-containing protein [Oscillospiraceae bacterium]
MYKNSFVHYLTKVLVDIMFYCGIVCCIVVPFVMPSLAAFFGYNSSVVMPFTIILTSSGLCALYIVWQLKSMFRTLLGGNPFVAANVSCLRKCSVSCFLIAIIYTIKLIFWFSFMTSVAVIIFSLIGLFCLTLKDIFKQAIAYKEENDWTV